MRKQDRIRQQQTEHPPEQQPKPESPRPATEKVKGGTSSDQPTKPPRQPGKMPLPD